MKNRNVALQMCMLDCMHRSSACTARWGWSLLRMFALVMLRDELRTKNVNKWAHSLAMYYELELQTAMNKLIITCNCRLSRGRATNLKLHDLETADRHQPEAHGSLHIHVLQRHALLLDRSYLALKPYYSGPTSSFHQVMQPRSQDSRGSWLSKELCVH